jgi:hypothetical protein
MGGGSRDRRDDRRDDRRAPSGPPPAPVTPAPVRIEFLPDDRCLDSIIKQIRTRHMAYPLFGLARMFLQEPARHWLQISLEPAAKEAGAALFQLGEDGPVAIDRQALEKIGFDAQKDQLYVEQTVQKDPPKGNFTNVARCRLSGTLLGPTNYHSYQTALRALYESRFSRRMGFEEFRRNIEVVNDPALVEKWKEETRTVVTISTREGDPPTVLNSPADARAHFRQHYFEGLLRTGDSFRLPGSVARNLPEAAMMMAIRQAHEPELRYPAHFVQLLRQALQNDGLHIFKHRKRFVYVSSARPTPFAGGGAVSENVAAILDIIGKNPMISRKELAERLLAGKSGDGESQSTAPAAVAVIEEVSAPLAEAVPAPEASVAEAPAPEAAAAEGPTADASALATEATVPVLPGGDVQAKAKAALAADLRFLVQAGHIIEFHNGAFDLPLPPKPKEEAKPKPSSAPRAAAKPEPAPAPASAPVHPAEPSASAEPETAEQSAALGEAELDQSRVPDIEAVDSETAELKAESVEAAASVDGTIESEISPSQEARGSAEP